MKRKIPILLWALAALTPAAVIASGYWSPKTMSGANTGLKVQSGEAFLNSGSWASGGTVIPIFAGGTSSNSGWTTGQYLKYDGTQKKVVSAALSNTSSLDASDGSPTEAVSVNASGFVSMSYQPSFRANHSASAANATGDGTAYSMPFDTETWDQGANFASNTFTAPVTGKYMLWLSTGLTSVGSGHTNGLLQIVTSNRTYTREWNPYGVFPPASNETVDVWVIADMDANDTATGSITISGSTKTVGVSASSDQRWFAGWLAH